MYAFFERLIQPFPDKKVTRPPTTLYAFCRYYVRGSEPYIILMAILTCTIALIEVSLFGFLGQLVDLLSSNTPEQLFEKSGNKLLLMGFMVLVGLPLVVLFQSTIIHQSILGNFPMAVRWLAHRYLLDQSVGFYQNEFAGRLATKVMQTALAVRESVMKLLDVGLYVAVYFTGIVVLVAVLDWRLVVPFIFWFASYTLLLRYFLPRLKTTSSIQADARSNMTGRLVDTYTNITTVKLFSHSFRESTYAREGMEEFLGTVHPQMRLATSLSVAVWFANCLLAFSVSALSIWLWTQNTISTGSIAAAIGLILRLFGMSQWIMWEVSALFENIGTVQDGMNTLTVSRQVQDKPNAPQLKIDHSQGIKFHDIRFYYGTKEKVIDNFSLHIRPGEKIGLVGRSGAGKSTLVNLLLRFYDVEGGSISVDGQNIADVTQQSLRSHIGMVTQDTSLLHRSIRDNLLYGKPDASEEDMIEAAKKAQAHDFIMGLVDAQNRRGYDAHAGERGVKLSGGQRQRIAIARVLLKDAPILILDEATSALDSEVEQAIQGNLNSLMENKTVIAIAHRLSTIAALDRLVVIDNGKIVEQGSHRELIARSGIYAQLWSHQSGGFLGES
ncbi:ABC transporter ATP-binding protein [Agarilytica rhodophyticola]|uniref:ABC transporter ATP-binding protein n=1 Tax=Agarilytica rhodophyticola TaxID=1737490 RepID=UPI000B346D73|nr:ABC transporter ATP-binding protein [Agarilytica rhodophyticola]